jgi:hypothetical protein
MAAEPGTFERIAMTLGDALAPLAEALRPERASAMLARLGVHPPESAFSPALRSAFGSAASRVNTASTGWSLNSRVVPPPVDRVPVIRQREGG